MPSDAKPSGADLRKLGARGFVRMKADPKANAPWKASLPPPVPSQNLPRQIWAYWDTGISNAPDLVQACFAELKHLHPDWKTTILDAQSAGEIIDPERFTPRLYKPHYADVLRSALLATHGGVWVDVTVLPLRPFDDWLPALMNQTEFFTFSRPAPQRMLNNWFIAAMPGSRLMRGWHKETQGFWSEPHDEYPDFYWHHYLFEYMIRTSRPHRQLWHQVPRLMAEPLMLLKRHLSGDMLPPEQLARIPATPMQKLSHKNGFGLRELSEALDVIMPTPR